MKKFFIATLVVLLVFFLTSLGRSADSPIRIKYATLFATGDPMVDAMEKFKEVVEKKSNGSIMVDLFVGGILGSEREILEASRSNSIQMTAESSLADCIFFAPEYAIFSTPYLIKNDDHANKVWASDVGREINEHIEKNFGIHTLGIMNHGPRHLTSNKKITTPDDLSGVRLRLPENAVYIKVWTALGATPVPVSFPEVYGALQTGVASSQENPLATINASKFYEVQKFLNLTTHVVEGYKIQCSSIWWNGLTDRQKRLIAESLAEATAYGNEVVAKSERDLIEDLRNLGMTVVEPDVEKFKAKALPTIQELGKSYFKPGLMDKVLALE